MQLSPETLRLLSAFALRTRRSFYGIRQGSHRSQRRGHGMEFAEFRNYELGDNPRYIDWNLFARSDKLLVKRYLEEENVALYIVIDGSRSMTHPSLREKWDLASHISAFASFIGLANKDPVTISVLGGPHSPRFWSGKAFGPLTSFLSEATTMLVTPEAQSLNLPEEARRAATRVTFPGICLILSDFLYPLEQVISVLGAFRARNMEVHAVQVLGKTDQSLGGDLRSSGITIADSETGEVRGLSLDTESRATYAELLNEHTEKIREHCRAHRVQFTSVVADGAPADAGISALTQMGLFV